MSLDTEVLQIIIFALIAGVILYRLYLVLGEKRGHEDKERAEKISIWLKGEVIDDKIKTATPPEVVPEKFSSEIATLKSIDPTFLWKNFIKGASQAFEIIISHFAKGTIQDIESLLSKDIYKDFSTECEARKKAGEVLETTLLRVESVTPEYITVSGTMARITLLFVTEQTHILRDESGHILEGDPKQSEEIHDTWTFQKDLKSSDPNWMLVKINS